MPFRRVIDRQAGPLALGILAPPAAQTLLIVRPRELPWDLVLTTTRGEPDFLPLSRHEAALQAQRLFRLLETQTVEISDHPQESGRRLAVCLADLNLLLCDRVPGRPYQATHLANAEAYQAAVHRLLAILLPGEQEQEVYFNTVHFEVA